MRRLILAAIAAATLSTSSGCYCLERLFCHSWDGCGLWSGCYQTCCGGDWSTDGYLSPGCGNGCCGGCGGCGHCGACGPLYKGFFWAKHDDCEECAGGHHGHLHERIAGNEEAANAGDGYNVSNAGSVTYPYYTTRGPRDFLARNPASIGR
jgi:hypothetical protein